MNLDLSLMNKPVIGILWGDFPWDAPPRKFGKLLSWGAVARTFTQALRDIGTVVPYCPSGQSTPQENEQELARFLTTIDLLCADFYPATGPALHLRSQLELRCPAMLIAGGTLPKGAEALLFPWQHLLRPDDALLFSCRADQEIWHGLVARSTLREYLVPCIVDIEVFHPGGEADRAVTRQKYGLPADSPILLYVGRRNIQKNLHTLFRLFAAVRERVQDAHLCLVGEEDDIQLAEFCVRNTGYRQWLERFATELGVAGHVTFLDSLFGDSLADLYRASDIVVNLSLYHRENFGLSQAEAEISGLPTVCSDWGGFKDVVKDGETGYLLETVITKHGVRVNWRAGVDHVVRLLEDAAWRDGMGARAAARARERFTLAPVTQELRNVVADIWQAGREAAPGAQRAAYEPSDFARRYEEHKRVSGWYANATRGTPSAPRWYPRMFEGSDYLLYEILMRPYATRLAEDLKPEEIQSWWVPYYPSGVELDPVRRIVRDPDPIWPHQLHADEREWQVCLSIDGTRLVAEIAERTGRTLIGIDMTDVRGILWRLSVEGFVLFCAPVRRGPR